MTMQVRHLEEFKKKQKKKLFKL